MLRRNIRSPSAEPHLPNTVAVQTDQFLLYLSVQAKLSALLQDYQTLKDQNNKSQDLLEYYEFKNSILENSLHELTFTFNNKMSLEKISLIDEISELDKVIERESQEIEQFDKMVVSELSYESKSKISKEEKSIVMNSSTSKENRNILKSGRVSMENIKKSQNLSEKSSPIQKSERTFRESHNQFLQLQQKFLNTHKEPDSPSETKVQSKNAVIQASKSTDRRVSSNQKLSKGISNKENEKVQKLIKREAELNLRSFLNNFESQNMLSKRNIIQ